LGWTLVTGRIAGLAEGLADEDDIGVEILVDMEVGGQAGGEEGLDAVVVPGFFDIGVAEEDAPGVGIDDEYGFFGGVAADGIGGLLADAVDGEQLVAQRGGVLGEEGVQFTAAVVHDQGDEVLDSFRLDIEIAGGFDEGGELCVVERMEGLEVEHFMGLKVGDGLFHVAPGGILGEDRTDHDFEGALAGPPAGWSIGGGKGMVER